MKLFWIAALTTVAINTACAAPVRHPTPHSAPPKTSALPAKPTEPPPRLYDFKGVPLEISIEEFRKLPHPDGQPAAVVCTGEKVGDSYLSEPTNVMIFGKAENTLGVQKCIWIYTTSQFIKWHQAGLSLADSGYAIYEYSFSFIRDPKDGVMRLYKFEGTSNVDATANVILALTKKFGVPTIVNGRVQNRVGNYFDQTTARWINSLASLMVQDRFSKIDDMGIVVVDNRLADLVAKEKATEAAATPNAI